jgi:CheY-like chemotaxis protein
MTSSEGQLLLTLAGRDLQRAAQLTVGSELGATETVQPLHRLVEQACNVAANPAVSAADVHLRPKAARPDELDPRRRILLVESDLALGELLTTLLEDEGYMVIAAPALAAAVAILVQVRFDLIITDGFSRAATAVLDTVAELRQAAGLTPIVLFTAHSLDPGVVLAAGFRALIEKPFELESFLSRIQALLSVGSPRVAGSMPVAAVVSGDELRAVPQL